jgi:riboflavin kinase/FMN adenylyltransferase
MEIVRDLDSLRPHPSPVVALGNFDGLHMGHQTILNTAIERARRQHGTAFALTFDPVPAKVLAPDRAPRLILTSEDKLELLRKSGIDSVRDQFHARLASLRRANLPFLVSASGCVAWSSATASASATIAGNGAVIPITAEFRFSDIPWSGPSRGPADMEEWIPPRCAGHRGRRYAHRRQPPGARAFPQRPGGSWSRTRPQNRFSTANIQSRTECLPPDGVYATRLILDDGPHASITNIGMRPTFAEPERTIEAHIFDFDRDIYDREVRLELIERIRPERKFDSGEALATQIAADLKRARGILFPA